MFIIICEPLYPWFHISRQSVNSVSYEVQVTLGSHRIALHKYSYSFASPNFSWALFTNVRTSNAHESLAILDEHSNKIHHRTHKANVFVIWILTNVTEDKYLLMNLHSSQYWSSTSNQSIVGQKGRQSNRTPEQKEIVLDERYRYANAIYIFVTSHCISRFSQRHQESVRWKRQIFCFTIK